MTTQDTAIAPPGRPTYNAIMLVRSGTAFIVVENFANPQEATLPGEFTLPGERHRDAAERALASLVTTTTGEAPTLPAHAFCVKHSPQHNDDHRRYTWVVHLDRVVEAVEWAVKDHLWGFWRGRGDFEAALVWPWRAQGLALVAGLQ